MEILNKDRPLTVEIHVSLTRRELEYLIQDMENDTTSRDPYNVTVEILEYLKEL